MALRILRYHRRTRSLCLRLGGYSPLLFAFTDADWGGDDVHPLDSFRSTSGGVAFFGHGPISWLSSLQRCTAKSSVESEFRAVSTFTDTVLWLRMFLTELGFRQLAPTPVLMDSKGAIASCYNPVNQKKLRHIEIHIHSVRERVLEGLITPVWLPGELEVADIFTKPLKPPLFKKFRDILFGLSPIQLPRSALRDAPMAHSARETESLNLLRGAGFS